MGIEITDPDLGVFRRATAGDVGGEPNELDYVVGEHAGVSLLIRSVDLLAVGRVMPNLRDVVEARERLAHEAVAAIVAELAGERAGDDVVARAQDDLVLSVIEIEPDGSFALHFDDTCGEHFLEGYWPAVSFDVAHAVAGVSVES